MPDEVTTPAPSATTPAPPAASGGKPEAAVETPPVAAKPDWASIVESVSPEELIRHPRIGGILGDRLQKAKERERAEWEAERAQEAAVAERDRLKRLRTDDPVAYAELMETREQQEEQATRLADASRKATREIAASIKAAVQAIPEFKDLTADDFGELAAAVGGKPDHEVLALYTSGMVKKLATRAAAKVVETEVAKRVEAEKAAWRTQWEAERLGQTGSPDMTRATKPSAFNPLKLKGKEYNDWYEKNVLGR